MDVDEFLATVTHHVATVLTGPGTIKQTLEIRRADPRDSGEIAEDIRADRFDDAHANGRHVAVRDTGEFTIVTDDKLKAFVIANDARLRERVGIITCILHSDRQ